MNNELMSRFLEDMKIPTQDLDSTFPYANLSDVGRALIKGRNWIPTLTQEIIDLSEAILHTKNLLRSKEGELSRREKFILGKEEKFPSAAFKSKESLKVFIYHKATEEEKIKLANVEEAIEISQMDLDTLQESKNMIEGLIRRLEKSNEWLSQYINLQKFELRGLNG